MVGGGLANERGVVPPLAARSAAGYFVLGAGDQINPVSVCIKLRRLYSQQSSTNKAPGAGVLEFLHHNRAGSRVRRGGVDCAHFSQPTLFVCIRFIKKYLAELSLCPAVCSELCFD